MLADDEDVVVSTTTAISQSAQPAWMRALHERCREWLDQLPSVSFTPTQIYNTPTDSCF